MHRRGFACTDCGGFAPPDGQGRPMWPGPRCTRCACAQYARRHRCPPPEAELRLYAERARRAPKIG